MDEENGGKGMNASLGLRESLFYLQELMISNVVDWLIIKAMILLRSQHSSPVQQIGDMMDKKRYVGK